MQMGHHSHLPPQEMTDQPHRWAVTRPDRSPPSPLWRGLEITNASSPEPSPVRLGTGLINYSTLGFSTFLTRSAIWTVILPIASTVCRWPDILLPQPRQSFRVPPCMSSPVLSHAAFALWSAWWVVFQFGYRVGRTGFAVTRAYFPDTGHALHLMFVRDVLSYLPGGGR